MQGEWENLKKFKYFSLHHVFYSVMGKKNIYVKGHSKLLNVQYFMGKSLLSQNERGENKDTDLYTFVFLEDEAAIIIGRV